MEIEVRRAAYQAVKALRELYRQEANCQIVHDSFLARGLADAYIILVNGRLAGYAGVGAAHPPNRLVEYYTLPAVRRFALPLLREVLAASGATHIEAQTNIPLMLLMLYECATNISSDALLFQDAFTTQLGCPDCLFRQATPEDAATIFPHSHEPVGEWVLVAEGGIVATGGFFSHYNPPYGDIYMEVADAARRQGFGSYVVQELKRVCYEAGQKPAARCDPANTASRRTLEKAGFLPCGRLLTGAVEPDFLNSG